MGDEREVKNITQEGDRHITELIQKLIGGQKAGSDSLQEPLT